MTPSSRIFVNTVFLYVKLIVTIVINLLLVRIVLAKLGVDDYGIYTLIAGIVTLLSFLNSALMSSAQRFLSVSLGEEDSSRLKRIMSSSVVIHLFFGLFIIINFELVEPLLFNHVINVVPERIPAAKVVYQLMVVSTVVTVIAVPYNALINAREDMWFFAIVEIAVAFMKLLVVILFKTIAYDALIIFTVWILLTTIIGIIAKFVWCIIKYDESRGRLVIKNNGSVFKELLSFTGWNALGSLAQAGRNQGVVLTINHFFGTAISAVFGIANQVNGNLSYFSQMLTTSVSPQIMKSFGHGDYIRMRVLSVFTSKMAFLLSALFALPFFVEMPYILDIWLKNVPPFTLVYCRLVMIIFLITELYPGLVRLIQAEGDIKWYQIGQSLLLIMPIPLGIILFNCGYESYSIVYLMVIAEILMLFFSIIYAKYKVDLDAKSYCLFVLKSVIIFVISLLMGFAVHHFLILHCPRFVVLCIVTLVTAPLFTVIFYLFVFNTYEKMTLKNKLIEVITKYKRK